MYLHHNPEKKSISLSVVAGERKSRRREDRGTERQTPSTLTAEQQAKDLSPGRSPWPVSSLLWQTYSRPSSEDNTGVYASRLLFFLVEYL